jgi:predicted ester cyclase
MNHLLASGPTLAVIPTVTALTIRHFRHKQGKDGGEAEPEPKHPAVRVVLGAWNDGDFSQADQHIAPDIKIYTNGLPVSSEHGGPAMARESIESWRALAPDLRMQLSQEIRDKDRIAIEFRITGTHTGDVPGPPASGGAIDVEGTAFLTLDGDKITEVWTVFDALALAVQTGAAEPPARWPGHS